MSFWEDASGATKGIIVVGVIGIIVSLLFLTGVVGGGEEELTQERGLPAATN